MNLGIVIPVFNQLAYTRQCLDSLCRAGIPDAKIEGDATAGASAAHTAEIWKLRRAGNSKSELARQLQICRTSVRRILGARS